MASYIEDNLENAFLELFETELGYDYIHGTILAPDGSMPERESYEDVFLKNRVIDALSIINPSLPIDAIEEVYKKIVTTTNLSLIENNISFHKYLANGVEIEYFENDIEKKATAYLIDYNNFENNNFLVVNQFTIIEHSNRRPDIIVFVNGMPLIVFEIKSLDEKVKLEKAYNDFTTYKQEIPTLFNSNVFLVISDGANAKAGTITSKSNRFMSWKSIDGKYENNNSQMWEYLVKGMFEKSRLIEIIKFFTFFQNSQSENNKILAAYHQYFAVKKAIASTINAIGKSKKAGVIWHTQGSGKSLSMVMYVAQLIQKLNNPTIVIITDRNDLDDQLFSTFSNSEYFLRSESNKTKSRSDLRTKLKVKSGGIIFTTIQKFTLDENEDKIEVLSDRSNIILIADEAHRSQYGFEPKLNKKTGKITYGYAKHVRDALPNATYIGFTGTPIESTDRSTKEIFGNYIDVYDMTQAEADGTTVKIYYENRIASLNLNENILKKIDKEYEDLANAGVDEYIIDKSKKEFTTLETIIGDEDRLDMLSTDIIENFEDKEKILDGKAMIICMSRKIACNLYDAIVSKRQNWHSDNLQKGKIKVVMTGSKSDPEFMKKHVYSKKQRDDLAKRMKKNDDELKIVIVVDMWLTGFDVPCLHTLYIDKMMKGHTLMQAIARVNRVFEGKEGGLVIDYIGIFTKLKEALQVYTKRDQAQVELDLESVKNKFIMNIEILNDMFYEFDYSNFFGKSELGRIRTIGQGADYIVGKFVTDKKIKDEFYKVVKELVAAEKLCRSLLTEKEKMTSVYFRAVKSTISKISGEVYSIRDVNKRIEDLINASIEKDTLISLGDILGIKRDSLNIFDENFLNEIKNMKQKNLALELLRKLLSGKIKAIEKTNIVKSEKFSEKLKALMNQYNNQSLSNAEIIEELIKMSKDIKKSYDQMNDLGLNDEEIAFYDALTKFKSVKEILDEDVLKELATELTSKVKSSKTIDWEIKESARATMRKTIKRLLKKYNYPPEHQKNALDIVIKQVEKMSGNISSAGRD